MRFITWIMAAKKNTLMLVIVTLLLGLFTIRFFTTAFPELTPEFSIKKAEVVTLSDDYARQFGLTPDQYQHVVTFEERTLAKYFLELNYGLDSLEENTDKGVRIWNWVVRYYIPGQEEEFKIRLDTTGKLVGFNHIIPESTHYDPQTNERSLNIARDFLNTHIKQHPIDLLELIESSKKEKEAHQVLSYTWQRRDLEWKDGKYRVQVNVIGNQVTRYGEYLDVPEAWTREFTKQRSENEIYQTVASALLVLMLIGIIVMFVLMMVRHEIHWHGFPFLWMIPVSIIFLVAGFSTLPQILENYPTQDSFGGYLTSESVTIVFSTIIDLLKFAIIAFIADAFWAKHFPHHTPIRSLLNGKGLATRESLRSIPLGFMFAVMTMAYVTAYYVIGKQFDIWTPSSFDSASVLTSYFPSIEALSVGISAAWQEEFLFRVLGISLIYRLTGSKWAAIIVSAVIWGFLHSNYIQMPGYARGIELTIEGIALGWIAVRFGILTTLLSHCLYNTWLGSLVAWQTGSSWHMSMAVIVSVWPVLLWLKGRWEYRRFGGYPDVQNLTSGSVPLKRQLIDIEGIIPFKTTIITPRTWQIILLVILSSFIISPLLPDKPLDNPVTVTINRGQAIESANKIFERETELDPGDFRQIAKYTANIVNIDKDYLLEHADLESISRHIRESLYDSYWKVHYFQEEQRNIYTVYLHSDGSFYLLNRSVAETTPGAQLDHDQAIKLAAVGLRKLVNLTPAQYRYINHKVTQRKARRDYQITFESTEWHIGESKLRWTIFLLGDKLNGLQKQVKIPEEYTRSKTARSWMKAFEDVIAYAGLIVLGIGILMLNGVLIVQHHVPWRSCLKLAFIMPAINILSQFNQAPLFFQNYQTTQSILNYTSIEMANLLIDLVWKYVYGLALFAVLTGLIRWLSKTSASKALLGKNIYFMSSNFSKGVLLGLFGASLIWAFDQISIYSSLLSGGKDLLSYSNVAIDGFSPAINSVLDTLDSSLGLGLLHGIFAIVFVLLWKQHRGILVLLLAIMLVHANINPDLNSTQEIIHSIIFTTAKYVLLAWLYLRLFRFNAFAYFFLYYFIGMLDNAFILTERAWPAYSLDIIALWLFVAAPFLISITGMIIRRNRMKTDYAI